MKIPSQSRRLGPAIAGKIRRFAEPVLRELEAVDPPAPASPVERAKNRASRSQSNVVRRPQATLTGWSTDELMAAVRNILKSGRAVARGRFLDLRI